MREPKSRYFARWVTSFLNRVKCRTPSKSIVCAKLFSPCCPCCSSKTSKSLSVTAIARGAAAAGRDYWRKLTTSSKEVQMHHEEALRFIPQWAPIISTPAASILNRWSQSKRPAGRPEPLPPTLTPGAAILPMGPGFVQRSCSGVGSSPAKMTS